MHAQNGVVDETKLRVEEKENRIIRMMKRKSSLLNKLMVKELVLELVNNMSTQVTMGTYAIILEDVLAEAMIRAEVNTVLRTMESVEGLEDRIRQELSRKEARRKKEARLARKLEMESRWLSVRNENNSRKLVEDSREEFMMEWVEHELEFRMASLGLEEDDLFNKEEMLEDDWLDTWILSLVPEVRKHDDSMDLVAEDTGVDMDTTMEEGMEDYMAFGGIERDAGRGGYHRDGE